MKVTFPSTNPPINSAFPPSKSTLNGSTITPDRLEIRFAAANAMSTGDMIQAWGEQLKKSPSSQERKQAFQNLLGIWKTRQASTYGFEVGRALADAAENREAWQIMQKKLFELAEEPGRVEPEHIEHALSLAGRHEHTWPQIFGPLLIFSENGSSSRLGSEDAGSTIGLMAAQHDYIRLLVQQPLLNNLRQEQPVNVRVNALHALNALVRQNADIWPTIEPLIDQALKDRSFSVQAAAMQVLNGALEHRSLYGKVIPRVKKTMRAIALFEVKQNIVDNIAQALLPTTMLGQAKERVKQLFEEAHMPLPNDEQLALDANLYCEAAMTRDFSELGNILRSQGIALPFDEYEAIEQFPSQFWEDPGFSEELLSQRFHEGVQEMPAETRAALSSQLTHLLEEDDRLAPNHELLEGNYAVEVKYAAQHVYAKLAKEQLGWQSIKDTFETVFLDKENRIIGPIPSLDNLYSKTIMAAAQHRSNWIDAEAHDEPGALGRYLGWAFRSSHYVARTATAQALADEDQRITPFFWEKFLPVFSRWIEESPERLQNLDLPGADKSKVEQWPSSQAYLQLIAKRVIEHPKEWALFEESIINTWNSQLQWYEDPRSDKRSVHDTLKVIHQAVSELPDTVVKSEDLRETAERSKALLEILDAEEEQRIRRNRQLRQERRRADTDSGSET